jgi:hypothetical protein
MQYISLESIWIIDTFNNTVATAVVGFQHEFENIFGGSESPSIFCLAILVLISLIITLYAYYLYLSRVS